MQTAVLYDSQNKVLLEIKNIEGNFKEGGIKAFAKHYGSKDVNGFRDFSFDKWELKNGNIYCFYEMIDESWGDHNGRLL